MQTIDELEQRTMQTEEQPRCLVCSGPGSFLYRDLPDRLFGAPGRWSFRACQDEQCGTLWLDPRPTREDIAKAYESYCTHSGERGRTLARTLLGPWRRAYAAVRYGHDRGAWPRTLARLLANAAELVPLVRDSFDFSLRHLPGPARGKVLDVGCGAGAGLCALAAMGWEAEGLEVDPSAARVAQGRGFRVFCGTLEDAPFEPGTFAVITSSHVFEHLHDPLDFLRRCARLLQPGGRLLFLTPNARGLGHQKHGAAWLALDPPRHLAIFSATGLRVLAERAGFVEIAVKSTTNNVAQIEEGSRAIGARGRYHWDGPASLAERARGQVALAVQALALGLGRGEGDELVLSARMA